MDMVGVGVGIENGVDSWDFFSQGLEAEVRAGVDDDAFAVYLEPGACSRSFVARVARAADGAVAADEGDSTGGAGAQDRHLVFGTDHPGGHLIDSG